MQRMGQSVRLVDQRLEPSESLHRGFRTKGPGVEAEWEFRFLELPPGLQEGSLLSLENDTERWRVQAVHFERQASELLFVSAIVNTLDSQAAPAPEDVESLLSSLRRLLQVSTLGPLEQDDVVEALDRFPKLLATASSDVGTRLKARLRLLGERFKACPQVSHEAKGQLLKLDALLKRKGLF